MTERSSLDLEQHRHEDLFGFERSRAQCAQALRLLEQAKKNPVRVERGAQDDGAAGEQRAR